MGKVFGYARVSSQGQSLDIQESALNASGCLAVFAEKASGTSTKGRPELKRVLAILGDGDTLVVTRLDRLARSMSDLLQITAAIEEKGASLKCLEQPFETTGPMGKLVRNILGVIAEFETELRRERQAEGITAAKARGVYKGRKPTVDVAAIRADAAAGKAPGAIAKDHGVSRMTVWRCLNGADKAAA